MMDDSNDESTTTVKILFFAKARELTGLKESIVFMPKKVTATDLTDIIIRKFSLETIQNNVILALNEEFILANATIELKEKDEIAIIPPLSGGKDTYL